MSIFFRKRPPYPPRHEAEPEADDDFPVVGPASESINHDDHEIPTLRPEPIAEEDTSVEFDDYEADDFPIVGPAGEHDDAQHRDKGDVERNNRLSGSEAANAVAHSRSAATSGRSGRQFTPSNKIRLPAAPAWVQEQADSDGISESDEISPNSPKPLPRQLENAIRVIINNEMETAEQRIKQKVLDELKNYFQQS